MIVFDMDGTLSDPTHRVHFLTQEDPDWDSFYEACDKDLPRNSMLDLLSLYLADGEHVEIWTGRRESTREKTMEWLSMCDIDSRIPVRMRKDGDFRHDTEVKREWIKEHGEPDLVFEDRNSMVKFYRDNGIECVQVQEGDF